MNQGMTNGTYVVKEFGENITIIIEKGNLKTAYGNWSYNLKDFGY